MWSDAYGTDLSHFSFLERKKPKCTWLSGAITRQAHVAFPVKFLFMNMVLHLYKGHGKPKMCI